MKMLIRIAAFLAMCSMMACSPFKPKLTDGVKEGINTLRVVSVIEHPTLGAQFNHSNGVGVGYILFGVPGAAVAAAGDSLINNAKANAAAEKIAPFRAALEGQNVAQTLHDSFESVTQELPWAKTVFESHEGYLKQRRAKIISEMEDDALLLLSTSYSLTPELESLEVITSVAIYKHRYKSAGNDVTLQLLEKMDPIYRGGIKFQSTLYGGRYLSVSDKSRSEKRQATIAKYEEKIARSNSSQRIVLEQRKEKELKRIERSVFSEIEGEADTVGSAWLENDAQLLKNTINLAASELQKMLSLDLNDPFSPTEYKKSKEQFEVAIMTGGEKTKMARSTAKGWLLDKTETRERIRLQDGYIYSVAKGDFLRPNVENRSSRK